MSFTMNVTAPSPLFGGEVGVLNIFRPSVAECNSDKLFNCTSTESIRQRSSVAPAKFTVGTQNLQICKRSTLELGANVRRRWARKEATPTIVAMTQIQSRKDGRSTGESSSAALRKILATTGVHQGPACFDALSASLVEHAGFDYTFMSGFAVSAVRLGAPDIGLLSYGEVLEQGRLITSAVSIPVIGDGDNGYGNALNVKRTVKGFIQAGFAGILIEDQVSPKSCGHFGGKRVVSREEALIRIKAAVDARSEASNDIVIIARSDARQAESLEEALWRVEQFSQLGADVLFIDALASKDEMRAFCKVAPNTPKMANMLEGGGRTPILSPLELEELGFKLVAYPLSLVGVSIQAMQDALKAIKSGRLPPPGALPSFSEIKDVVKMKEYDREDERYAFLQLPSSSTTQNLTPDAVSGPEGQQTGTADSQVDDGEGPISVLVGDTIHDLPDTQDSLGSREDSVILNPDIQVKEDINSTASSTSNVWSRILRVKITGSTGNVKLDVRIPAGFLDGLSSTIPGFAGFNIKKVVDDATVEMKGSSGRGRQLADFTDRQGDRLEIFLE